jgi:two-component system, NarL family, response regulator DegU
LEAGPILQELAPPSSSTRLVLAQPHALIGDALEHLLEEAGLEVIGRCGDAAQLERCLQGLAPDLALVDADMAVDGDVEGLLSAACRGLRGGRLVLLASEVDAALARRTLHLAVDGVVLKCASSEDVVGALWRVAAGDVVLPAGWIAAARRGATPLLDTLSARQVEVLVLLAQGLANEAIADRLFISRNTVKFHVAAIYQRLGVRNRVQAAQALEAVRSAG